MVDVLRPVGSGRRKFLTSVVRHETGAVGTRELAEVVVKGVVFFDDDHNMLDRGRSGGRARRTAGQQKRKQDKARRDAVR